MSGAPIGGSDDAEVGAQNGNNHKARFSVAERKKEKRVRIKDASAKEQLKPFSRVIQEHDATAGYERFYGAKIGANV